VEVFILRFANQVERLFATKRFRDSDETTPLKRMKEIKIRARLDLPT